MSKTITLRVNDDVYSLFKKAANGSKRTISNFLEFAAISYLSQEAYVSDEEMEEILNDQALTDALQKGMVEIESGEFEIVA